MNLYYSPDLLFVLFFVISAILIIYLVINICCCSHHEEGRIYLDRTAVDTSPLIGSNQQLGYYSSQNAPYYGMPSTGIYDPNRTYVNPPFTQDYDMQVQNYSSPVPVYSRIPQTQEHSRIITEQRQTSSHQLFPHSPVVSNPIPSYANLATYGIQVLPPNQRILNQQRVATNETQAKIEPFNTYH